MKGYILLKYAALITKILFTSDSDIAKLLMLYIKLLDIERLERTWRESKDISLYYTELYKLAHVLARICIYMVYYPNGPHYEETLLYHDE